MKKIIWKWLLVLAAFAHYDPLFCAAPCPPCPATGLLAGFCNVNVSQQLCVSGNSQLAGDLTVCGDIINNAIGFGNVVRVDKVYGTASGARNGAPFATINQALAVAQAGDMVWVFPGTYEETLVIPAGVQVRGAALGDVIIQRTGVTSATDLITMGEGSSLQNIVLRLTSSAHVALRGGVFPGTTAATAFWLNVKLSVDNSGAGAGSSNVYGIHSSGTGQAAFEFATVQGCAVAVRSTGNGIKRGVLVSGANIFNANDTDIIASGGADSIGVETANAGALFAATSSNISGDTADISQTAGELFVTSTNLENSEANGLGFETAIAPGNIVWVDPLALTSNSGSSYFMSPGTFTTSGTETFVPVSQPLLVKALAAQAVTAPGVGENTVWTLRKNGGDTGFTVTLAGAQTYNVNDSISVHFDQGDLISLRVETSAFASTVNVSLLMDIY